MAALPPVLAATALAPENFRSLRRSIRVMVFPPYHPEAFRCTGGSLKPTAAWHKPAPHLVRQKVKGSGRAAGLLAPFGSAFSGAVPFERIGFEPSDGMRPESQGCNNVTWPATSSRMGLTKIRGSSGQPSTQSRAAPAQAYFVVMVLGLQQLAYGQQSSPFLITHPPPAPLMPCRARPYPA